MAAARRGAVWIPGAPPPSLSQVAGTPRGTELGSCGPASPSWSSRRLPGGPARAPTRRASRSLRDMCAPWRNPEVRICPHPRSRPPAPPGKGPPPHHREAWWPEADIPDGGWGRPPSPFRALSLLESRQGRSEGKEPEQGGFQLRPISQRPSLVGGYSWECAPRGPRLQLLAGSGDLGNAARTARRPPLSHLPEWSPHSGRRPRASLVTNHRHFFRVLSQRLDAGRERTGQAARGPQSSLSTQGSCSHGNVRKPRACLPSPWLDPWLQDMQTPRHLPLCPGRWPAASAVGRSRHAASAKGRQ